MEIKKTANDEKKNMKMNKLEKSEVLIHPIGIKFTQSMNELHLFGFVAIIVTANQR